MPATKSRRKSATTNTGKLTGHIVSTTHWDREWYLPFEEFRFHLVRLMDRVLDLFATQRDFRHFVTDGQAIMIEDYLEVRPDLEDTIRRHVRSGALVIGPWYNLPDEYIVSGESLVRNLLMGRRVARRFGAISKAGYVPDPFGHVAQLPQILRGFGIDNFIFLRGMPPDEKLGLEFTWQAPDGSGVLALWMKNLYMNASMLGFEAGWGDSEKMKDKFSLDHAFKRLDGQVEDLGSKTRANEILLVNGCDHTPPQYELTEVMRAANRHFKNAQFVHSTFDKYVEATKKTLSARKVKLPALEGEMRSSRYIVILPGVLSTRMYLKQWNRRCEAMLERWAEPFAAMLRHLGGPDLAPNLVVAWRLLLQNHPHDSICGCSVDAVHREMMTRFEKCEQIARWIITHAQVWLHSRIDTQCASEARSALVAWNPLPGRRRGPITGVISFTAGDVDKFYIVDSKGHPLPQQITHIEDRYETPFMDQWRRFSLYEVVLDTPADGLGYQTFWIKDGAAPKSTSEMDWSKNATTKSISTEFYRINFRPNGTFDIFDRRSKQWHRGQHLFEDTEDVGDEYDYSPSRKGSKTLTTRNCRARIRIVQRGAVFVEYEIIIPWKIPAACAPNRLGRAKQLVDMTIRTNIRVYRHHRRIECVTTFNNKAADHRLRVHFPGPANAKRAIADGHFAHIDRAFQMPTTKQHDSAEPTTHHMRHFVALTTRDKGMAILNRALTEYEILSGSRGERTIAITLLRSVGFLSRDDLANRPSYAGPGLPTPEAQCIGPYQTEYALLPWGGGDASRNITSEAESYAAPAILTLEPIHAGSLPPNQAFIHLDNDESVWSTWKPAEQGSGSVIRFYNPSSRKMRIKLGVSRPMAPAGFCDLKEDNIKSPDSVSGNISLRPGQIVSMKLKGRSKRKA